MLIVFGPFRRNKILSPHTFSFSASLLLTHFHTETRPDPTAGTNGMGSPSISSCLFLSPSLHFTLSLLLFITIAPPTGTENSTANAGMANVGVLSIAYRHKQIKKYCFYAISSLTCFIKHHVYFALGLLLKKIIPFKFRITLIPVTYKSYYTVLPFN